MSYWTNLVAAAFGQSQPVGAPDNWLIRAIGGGKTAAGVTVVENTALQLPVVYACVNRISNPIARFPMKIMRAKQGGGVEEATDHPMSLRIGLRPNDFMSSRTVRKTVMTHALLWGNGYLEIERNNKGQGVNFWPLLPWATAPQREDDRLFYRTTIDGRQFKIDQRDVLHIMDISQDGYVGLSPVAMAREALGLTKALETFGGKFFANDAKSGGFLLHPGKLSGQAHQNLRGANGERRADPASPASRMEAQGGLDNAHRVKVLEEGMKYVQTTIPPEDAQFLGTRVAQIGEIARMYDVPLILLQSHDGVPSWGAGIEQLMIGFVRQTIEPWVAAWEQELNWKLFTEEERERGYYVKFNMNALLRGDMAARAAFYKALFEVAAITPNQICGLEDWEPAGPDGDARFVSANLQSLENAINPPDPPAPPAATEGPAPEPEQVTE